MLKELIIKHIQSILPLVFSGDEENIIIDIFDESSQIPDFVHIEEETDYEFVVVLSVNKDIAGVEDKAKRLSQIISKSIIHQKIHEKVVLFWVEGLRRKNPGQDEIKESFCHESSIINKIKSDTVLPNWLDKLIFGKLKGKYKPDYEKYDRNLKHSEEEILTYLGTYFPRSYAEAFCVFEDLFMNGCFKAQTKEIKDFHILDIGCGTGGNLIGLLTAVQKHYSSLSSINVWAIDGNTYALQILKKILDHFNLNYIPQVNYELINKTTADINSLKNIIGKIPCQSFDFIMSFKMLGELITDGQGQNNDSYYKWFELVSAYLEPRGLIVQVDVTIKTNYSNYLPILLNKQAFAFIADYPEFSILSPLACSYYSTVCDDPCFTQHEFFVTHNQKSGDASRVALKIIGKKEFVKSILPQRKSGKFIINWKQYGKSKGKNGICKKSVEEEEIIDSYKIS